MNKIIYPAFLFPRQLANLKKSNKYSNIFRFFLRTLYTRLFQDSVEQFHEKLPLFSLILHSISTWDIRFSNFTAQRHELSSCLVT